MFEHCYFITGSNQAIIIVVPEHLPEASILNVSVTPDHISFAADYKTFARVPYADQDVYNRLCEHSQIGMIAYAESQSEPFPSEITHMAYVEVWEG